MTKYICERCGATIGNDGVDNHIIQYIKCYECQLKEKKWALIMEGVGK